MGHRRSPKKNECSLIKYVGKSEFQKNGLSLFVVSLFVVSLFVVSLCPCVCTFPTCASFFMTLSMHTLVVVAFLMGTSTCMLRSCLCVPHVLIMIFRLSVLRYVCFGVESHPLSRIACSCGVHLISSIVLVLARGNCFHQLHAFELLQIRFACATHYSFAPPFVASTCFCSLACWVAFSPRQRSIIHIDRFGICPCIFYYTNLHHFDEQPA